MSIEKTYDPVAKAAWFEILIPNFLEVDLNYVEEGTENWKLQHGAGSDVFSHLADASGNASWGDFCNELEHAATRIILIKYPNFKNYSEQDKREIIEGLKTNIKNIKTSPYMDGVSRGELKEVIQKKVKKVYQEYTQT